MLKKHSKENIVLQAVMDEFEENREKGNLTAELLNREKVTKREILRSPLIMFNCITIIFEGFNLQKQQQKIEPNRL